MKQDIKESDFSLSLFFPAYREEENIKPLLQEALGVAKALTKDYEIIVIDDGSDDRTSHEVKKFSRNEKHIRLIRHKRNQGYGGAVWHGICASKKDLIFFSDADRQFHLDELKRFIEKLNGFDALIGYRNPRHDPKIRLLNAWGWKVLVQSMFKVRIRDVDCAFKLFRRELLESIDVKSRGAMFSAELMIRLIAKKKKIGQLPVGHYPRKSGRATGAKPAVIFRAFKEFFSLRRELQRELEDIPVPDRKIKSL